MFRSVSFTTKLTDSTAKATGLSSLLIAHVVRDMTRIVGLGVYTPEDVAYAVTILSGFVLVGLGALRLGWVSNFIPRAALDAFATAACLRVMIGQLPTLFGLIGVRTKGPTHLIFADTMRNILHATVDTAFGISAFVLLATVGHLCAVMVKRHPAKQRLWGFISALRFPVTIGFSTLISYLIDHDSSSFGTPFRRMDQIHSGMSIMFPKASSSSY